MEEEDFSDAKMTDGGDSQPQPPLWIPVGWKEEKSSLLHAPDAAWSMDGWWPDPQGKPPLPAPHRIAVPKNSLNYPFFLGLTQGN